MVRRPSTQLLLRPKSLPKSWADVSHSEVGEEFVSSEEEARMELSYASARGSEYIAPPLENPIPISVPAPCHPYGLLTALPALEEITEEPTFICEDVRKLDLSHLCFPLNFYFLMFLSQFPSMFPLLTYSYSFFSLSADYPRHSR